MRTKTKTGSLLSTALAMVLSLTMTVGLCPASALAAALEEDAAPVELEEGGGEAPAEGAEDGAGIQPEEDGEDALVVQGQEGEGEAELLPQEEPLVLEGGTNAESDENAEDAPEAQGQEAEGEVALQPQGEQYALWVGGTQVTDASSSGDGWSYDAATSTLTLDGYDYSADGHGFDGDMYDNCYAAVYAGQDLTIQLSGTNTLKNEKSNGYGVYVRGGDLTITSTDSGTLNATGTRAGIFAYGGNVTVNGGTVNATSNDREEGIGIYAVSRADATSGIAITIKEGSKVTAAGDLCGMRVGRGDVTIAGGEVTATATGEGGVGINAGEGMNPATQQTFGGNVTISGGKVDAKCDGSGGAGIVGYHRVAFEGGTVTAAGNGDDGIGVYSFYNIDFNGGTITVFGKYRGIDGMDGVSVSFATGVSAMAGEDENSAKAVPDIEQWGYEEKWIRLEPAHTHAVGEGEGAQTITFQPWTDALAAQQHGPGGEPNHEYTAANSLPTEAGNYLLTKDVKLDETKGETWTVPEGTTNLCLGGKTITGDLSREKNVINIPENRTLNLYDDEAGAGKIVSKNYEKSGQPAYVTVVRCAGKFTMNGGTLSSIEGEKVDTGVNVRDGATFTMNGGTIQNVDYAGVDVYAYDEDAVGTFTMSGGTITDCAMGVYNNDGTFTMSGGTIADCGEGVWDDGTFTMSGGTITGCAMGVWDDGTFNLSGNPDISGNSEENVYLEEDARITVAGALSNATPIGVAMNAPGVFTTSTDPKAKGYLSNFASDDDKYTVVAKGDELALQHNAHSFTYAASGATITATCDEKGLCDLTDKKFALTIKAPTLTAYGQTGDGISERATLDGLDAFNAATGKNVSADSVRYFPARREGTEVKKTGEALPKAPTDAGDYVAEVTLAGVRTGDAGVTAVTAYVSYAIGKATPAFEHFAFAPPADPTHDGQAKTASVTAKAGVKGMGAVTVGYYSDAACTAAAEPKGVGTYYVGVTVAEGDNFYATADGTVLHGEGWTFEIAKAAAVPASVSANDRTYDGTSRPLVKVEGEATGGKMQYALGKDAKTAPTDGWSTSIPAATDAGTYHVWYRVRGDANHGDLAAKSVKTTVAPREAKLAWKGTSFTYDGKSHAPTATVSNLAAGDKCSVTVVGAAKAAGSHTATATKLGNANYKLPAKATQAFKIAKAKLTSIAKVADKTYTGKAIKPTPAVKAGKRALEAGTDFSYSYKNNVKAGTATVTAKGKGNYAGTVKTTFKVVAPSCSYRAHVQGTGWQAWAKGGSAVIGTSGKGLRLEAIQLKLGKSFPVAGGIEYRAHVQTYGWEKAWAKDGATCGTTGQSRRLEAVQVRLTGAMAKRYDVYYRVHAQTYGWMAWAKNGAKAGTEGQAKRLEAVQIVLLPKGAKAPGTTYEGVKQQYAKAFV